MSKDDFEFGMNKIGLRVDPYPKPENLSWHCPNDCDAGFCFDAGSTRRRCPRCGDVCISASTKEPT